MSIAKLLEVQKVDQERLNAKQDVEKCSAYVKVKKNQQIQQEAEEKMHQVDADVQKLQGEVQTYQKLLADLLAEIEKAKQSHRENRAEYDEYLSRLTMLGSQFDKIQRLITDKKESYQEASQDSTKASRIIKQQKPIIEGLATEYQKKRKELLKKSQELAQGVEPGLYAKYQEVRKSKGEDPQNVVVPLQDDGWCSGCGNGLPMDVVNKIKSVGWATCDRCGRIIYQDGNLA